MAVDKNQLIEMYEKMRGAALGSCGTRIGRHSFGQVVLSQKGILAWAQTCAKMHLCRPIFKPAQPHRRQTEREIDLSDELKNALTLMALNAVQGVEDATVNGI